MRRTVVLALCCLVTLAAGFATAASACRVRRGPSVGDTGVPNRCSQAFSVRVRVLRPRGIDGVGVRLDSRTLASTGGRTLRVRVPCDRLSAGVHDFEIVVRSGGTVITVRRYVFRAS